jgi:alkylglycerol monooxygenase
MPNYIALAVPFFFLLIGVELAVARARGRRVYRLTDSMVDLSSGTLQQVLMIFAQGALLAAYFFVYQHRWIDWPAGSAWPWLIAFVGYDFTYYWWHRLSHEVNFLWAAHITHHQSEEFNLSVALRQSFTSPFTSLPFSIGLALLGVPVLVYSAIASFSLLYQFWIHTELIGRMGPFEWIFNTPSQHRVHHAVNPRYLDRNYAGTLCIWDRMFGSFEPETQPCVYGLVKPLGSFQPLWVQLHRYVEVARMSRAAPALADKLKVWLKGPEWSVPGLPPLAPPPEVTDETRPKYDPRIAPGLRRYLWLQLVLTMTGSFLLIFFQQQLPRPTQLSGALLITLSVACWGGLIEQRRWALPLELVRLGLVVAAAMLLPIAGMQGPLPLLTLAALTALQAALLRRAVSSPATPAPMSAPA